MNYFLFLIVDGFDVEEVRRELEKKGLRDTFIIEDDASGEIFIGGHAKKKIESGKALLVEQKKAEVDWEEQWSLFAENFSEGKAHIAVGEKTLLLTPGAGFGDLSHPTTCLMLEMMEKRVKGQSVIDVGTGSGILALAALLCGARSAIGIDIEPKALLHAKENAKLNGLKATFAKTLPKKIPKENTLLMNMIVPEQVAFGPDRLNHLATQWIVSGVLTSQKKSYLAQVKKWDWELETELQKGEWHGFIFKKCKPALLKKNAKR